MAVLGVSSITPAFPKIMAKLGISSHQVGLLITVFTLPGVFLTPVAGLLADRYGRKKVLIPALIFFGFAGSACFFTNDFHVLLALRFLQGIGAAPIGSLNATLIGDLYGNADRIKAMGYNSSVLSVGTASYPAIGGALALIGWNWPFLLHLFAFPVALFILTSLKNPEPKSASSLKDYLGGAWKIIGTRAAVGLFAAGLVTFLILYGSYLTYFPLLLAGSFKASPLLIGVLLSSSSVVTVLVSWKLGRLAERFSEKSLIRISFLFYAAAMLIVPFVRSVPYFVVATALFGIAMGINTPSIMKLLTDLAPLEQRAAVMAVNGMIFRAGQTLGPILMGAAVVFGGISYAFFAGAALALATLAFLLIMIR